jgi:hypothetical protein
MCGAGQKKGTLPPAHPLKLLGPSAQIPARPRAKKPVRKSLRNLSGAEASDAAVEDRWRKQRMLLGQKCRLSLRYISGLGRFSDLSGRIVAVNNHY